MPKFFVTTNQINGDIITIENEDVNHIKNVLRAKVNDQLEICNCEKLENYICKISKIEDKKISCEIVEKKDSDTESNIKVSIFQGLPKADKMELIIQKSVELGAFDITPVEMKRCVVKLRDKDRIKKIERWRKISEVAAKQCGRDIIPNVNDLIDINEICKKIMEYDTVIVAYENEKENTIKKELLELKENDNLRIAVIIGPEGGLEEKDVEILKQNGAKIVTLGKRILRTETVALNVLSILMYELEQDAFRKESK